MQLVWPFYSRSLYEYYVALGNRLGKVVTLVRDYVS